MAKLSLQGQAYVTGIEKKDGQSQEERHKYRLKYILWGQIDIFLA